MKWWGKKQPEPTSRSTTADRLKLRDRGRAPVKWTCNLCDGPIRIGIDADGESVPWCEPCEHVMRWAKKDVEASGHHKQFGRLRLLRPEKSETPP